MPHGDETMSIEIKIGSCYVGPLRGSSAFIRRVMDISDKWEVAWKDFGVHDGASIGSGRCSGQAFDRWVAREATPEEIARLHISENDGDVRIDRHLEAMREGVRLHERMLIAGEMNALRERIAVLEAENEKLRKARKR
jgi:hypothetical protein